MNINEGDRIKLRKDIERVRKHEESRRPRKANEEHVQSAPASARNEVARRLSIPIAVRLRRMLEALLAPARPSNESLEAIPEHVVTLLQVIREEPKFQQWLLAIEALPPTHRIQQLEKMSFAFRIEDRSSTIAESFDRLRDSILFKAFCQTLRDEKQTPA
jgi:hypothetical protein